VSNLRPIVPGNLRPAPTDLTPQMVGRFLSLADALSDPNSFPLDASVAAPCDVHAPHLAAEEAGRDLHGGNDG
jgi:hypothetical protein